MGYPIALAPTTTDGTKDGSQASRGKHIEISYKLLCGFVSLKTSYFFIFIQKNILVNFALPGLAQTVPPR